MNPLLTDLLRALDPVRVFEAAFTFPALPWQVEYLRERRAVCLVKSRQIGASLAAGALCIHLAMYVAGSSSIVVSPSQNQSREILARARTGLRAIGQRLVADSATVLRLPNGSTIRSLPGTARSVRGWTADLLVLDEAAYIGSETWVAAQPLIATGGRLIAQSTPANESGPFYELATSEDPELALFTIPATEVAIISAEFLASQRSSMTAAEFSEEYEAHFGSTGGGRLFTLDRLSRWLPDQGDAA